LCRIASRLADERFLDITSLHVARRGAQIMPSFVNTLSRFHAHT
jgi:hypothetical protein